MAIVASNLTHGQDSSGTNTSKTTASISPASNALILLSLAVGVNTAGNDVVPNVSGCGLTWVQVATIENNQNRLTVWRALGASPTTGTVVMDFGGTVQDGSPFLWSINQFTGVNTSGANGAGAVAQSASGTVSMSTGTVTQTLSSFADSNNVGYGAIGAFTNETTGFVAGVGFTQLSQDSRSSDNKYWHQTEDKLNDNVIKWTVAASANVCRNIGLEIAVAPVAGANPGWRSLLGVGI